MSEIEWEELRRNLEALCFLASLGLALVGLGIGVRLKARRLAPEQQLPLHWLPFVSLRGLVPRTARGMRTTAKACFVLGALTLAATGLIGYGSTRAPQHFSPDVVRLRCTGGLLRVTNRFDQPIWVGFGDVRAPWATSERVASWTGKLPSVTAPARIPPRARRWFPLKLPAACGGADCDELVIQHVVLRAPSGRLMHARVVACSLYD